MKHYDISTLDPSPAMTRTTVEFLGTFAQAVNAAHASFDRTGRATAIFDHNGSYAWYRIDGGGRVTNNNTVDDLHLDSGFCFDYKHQAWVKTGDMCVAGILSRWTAGATARCTRAKSAPEKRTENETERFCLFAHSGVVPAQFDNRL